MLTDGHADFDHRGLSTFYHDAKDIFSAESAGSKLRLIWKDADDSRVSYRHSLGMPFVYNNELSYPKFPEHAVPHHGEPLRPNPTLNTRWTFCSFCTPDHEQNCSTSTIRNVGSSHVDPISATGAAIAALLRSAARRGMKKCCACSWNRLDQRVPNLSSA